MLDENREFSVLLWQFHFRRFIYFLLYGLLINIMGELSLPFLKYHFLKFIYLKHAISMGSHP